MRISWNWLNELVDLNSVKGPKALAELLTFRGLEVETIEAQGAGFESVVTAEILERNPHPQADRLSVCKVTTGSGEPLEIVCGAQNMKTGDRVALAQIGAHLPNNLKIEKSKIRGVVSNGMLCSEEELKLKEKSEGILILPPGTPLGRPLAEVLGRNDTVLDIKLTANRGDCMSHYGIAREIAAALGKPAKKPKIQSLSWTETPIAIRLDAKEAAPQFFGCLIEGVKIGPSPDWLVQRLKTLGSRSINNVVDATNLVMLELGHPMHAYDADRIEGKTIRVRMARPGETLPLLDGQTVTLAGTELVIADGTDGKRAVGLAGVMGGGNTEVQDSTTRLFLECAEFDPKLVRKAASRHQRKTEAAQRFEKGIDPGGLGDAISRLAGVILQLAGGKVVGAAAAQLPGHRLGNEIRVSVEYFQEFLGMSVPAEKAEQILIGFGCKIAKKGGDWTVTAPSFRCDLTIREDLAEEIARSLGYDVIEETIPPLNSPPESIFGTGASSGSTGNRFSAASFHLLNRAKDALVDQGLNETINLAFTSHAWLSKFGLEPGPRVLNPLSEEQEYLVPSLIPGLVKNALDNWHHHFGSELLPIRLFELRPVFSAPSEIRASGEMETGAIESWKLAFAISGPRYARGLRNEQGEVDFYDVKAILENLWETLGTKGVRIQPLDPSRGKSPLTPLFHPGQSAEILAGKESGGVFGLLHPRKARELKTRAQLWIGELSWDALAPLSRPVFGAAVYRPWPQYPSIERDFALLVRNDISVDKITQLALRAGRPLAKVAKIFDVYRGSQVSEGMTSVAVRVIFYEENRSLQESEAEAASSEILNTWKKELGVELRG